MTTVIGGRSFVVYHFATRADCSHRYRPVWRHSITGLHVRSLSSSPLFPLLQSVQIILFLSYPKKYARRVIRMMLCVLYVKAIKSRSLARVFW